MIRTVLLGLVVVVVSAFAAGVPAARAEGWEHRREAPRGGGERWEHARWEHREAWRGPVVRVAPPPVYYAPPPVYYAPRPVFVAPGVNIGVFIP